MSKANINILRSDELTHAEWSGGTTTQLAIWPQESSYAERNFKWRISSAVVRDEVSEFTHLPGIHRHLMVLDGEIEISHGQDALSANAPKKMKPFFSVDEFDGGIKTVSRGTCTDFNLMTAEGYNGEIQPVIANKRITLKSKTQLPRDTRECWFGLYAVADGILAEFILEEQYARITFDKGDFMLLSYNPKECGEITLTVKYGAEVPAVCASVWH